MPEDSVLQQMMLLVLHTDYGRRYTQFALSGLYKECNGYLTEAKTPEIEPSFVHSATSNFLNVLANGTDRCPL